MFGEKCCSFSFVSGVSLSDTNDSLNRAIKYWVFYPMDQLLPSFGPSLERSCCHRLGRRDLHLRRLQLQVRMPGVHVPLPPRERNHIPHWDDPRPGPALHGKPEKMFLCSWQSVHPSKSIILTNWSVRCTALYATPGRCSLLSPFPTSVRPLLSWRRGRHSRSSLDYSEARLTHRYDPVTQRWESMGKMPGPITDIRACLLHLP